MRRTIRKTFLLEGETVTMKYVKQLCGIERLYPKICVNKQAGAKMK